MNDLKKNDFVKGILFEKGIVLKVSSAHNLLLLGYDKNGTLLESLKERLVKRSEKAVAVLFDDGDYAVYPISEVSKI